MACSTHHLWWFRMTCFFFFGGLTCFVPLLTPHLKWLGLNLREISAIHLIAGVVSMLGLLLAAASSTHRGHRICLAVALLLAAFSSAALVFVPRLQGHSLEQEAPPPVAEVLCSPEGSVLFFRQCGTSCELDRTDQIDLQITDCQFEPRTKISTNWQALIEQFNFIATGPETPDASEPERGDLPDKPRGGEEQGQHTEQQQHLDHEHSADYYDTDIVQQHINQQIQSPVSPEVQEVDQYDYDLRLGKGDSRRKRQFDQEDVVDFDTEESEIPFHFQPHLCYETRPQSKLCHVFTNTEHTFRMESAFRTGIAKDGRCFYPLLHNDYENQLLSEVHCRLHRDDLQVRCKAEGLALRARVAHNGTNICSEDPGNFHLTFWLYLLFRSLAEFAVIAALVLLYMVSLDCEQRELYERETQQLPKPRYLGCWWLCAALGAALFGVVAGLLCAWSSFAAAFLLGAVLFGLAAFMIGLAPHSSQQPCVQEEQNQFQVGDGVTITNFWISRRLLGKILAHKKAGGILAFTVLIGTGLAHVHILFYWFLVELKSSYVLVGSTMSTAVVFAAAVFPSRTWLWFRCGHNYIFMIGLLLYAVRFLSYAIIRRPLVLIFLESLEVFCNCWMLLTALLAISALEKRTAHVMWKVNAWALIIIFHYSIGRGLGGLYAGLLSFYFRIENVFVGTAIIFVLGAALWLLLYLTMSRSQKKYQVQPAEQGNGNKKGSPKPDKQQGQQPVYTPLETQQAKKGNLKN